MTVPATRDDFLDLVRRTGAAEKRRLDAFLEQFPAAARFADPKALATGLVRDGILTEFQAKQLLSGRPENLVLGKYDVLDLLGTGSMSTVFLCRHPAMDRWVAVKLLSSNRASQPVMLKRFHREARAAATVHHPNIVHAFDFEENEKGLFLVMEYIDGITLRKLVVDHSTLSPRRAAHYISQSAVGLQHAHESGLVHRDVKPGNLMLDRSGVVKVLDLGLALVEEEASEVLTQGVLGTVDYLAPEQTIDSHNVDCRADVYGLGATFYFMLTGSPPCGSGTVTQKVLAHRSQPPRPLRSFRGDVPTALEAVLLRMLAKDRNARYQTMTAVMEALAPWTQEPIDPPAEKEMPRYFPTVRPAPPREAPTAPPVSLPVVPPSGLTPIPSRVAEMARAVVPPTTPVSTPQPRPPSSAYRSSGDPNLRPLVFPSLPSVPRPGGQGTLTPAPPTRAELPAELRPKPLPVPAWKSVWGGKWLIPLGIAMALGVGVLLGLLVAAIR
jgi:serine/threonine protein kinase